jgi:hypothetical protein
MEELYRDGSICSQNESLGGYTERMICVICNSLWKYKIILILAQAALYKEMSIISQLFLTVKLESSV